MLLLWSRGALEISRHLNQINTTNSMTMQTSKSFIKVNSQSDININKKLDRFDSWRESISEPLLEDTFGPLSNVR